MPVENSTPNRAYPLPFADNNLVEDVDRLIVALMGLDLDVANLITAVATKAAAAHGHTIADTTGLQGALDSKQDLDEKGQANGFASLDATGKVPTSQLPAAVLGAVSYQGVWNAGTNTPTIPAASAANKGHYFKVATAGSTNVSGETDWKVGDWIISNGATWDKADHTDQVMSVAGLMGVITAAALKAALEIAIADVAGLQAALNNKADAARKITTAGLATGGGTFQADREIAVPKSTNPQAVAGTDDTTAMTPIRVAEAVAARVPATIAGVYTGTVTDEVNFPIGHPLLVINGGAGRNGTMGVKLHSTTGYNAGTGGTQLSGVWRWRGGYGNSDAGLSAWLSLIQRTA